MGVLTAQAITDKVAILVQDAAHTRYPATELLGWVNDGIALIAAAVPSSVVKYATLALTANAKQSIPSDGFRLFEVISNVRAGGTLAAITLVDRRALTAMVPTWINGTAAADVLHYTFDPYDPKTFFVYPPNNGTGSVYFAYSAVPAALTVLSQTIPVDDGFVPALVDYTTARALAKEDESAAEDGKAQLYAASFSAYLSMRAEQDRVLRPC